MQIEDGHPVTVLEHQLSDAHRAMGSPGRIACPVEHSRNTAQQGRCWAPSSNDCLGSKVRFVPCAHPEGGRASKDSMMPESGKVLATRITGSDRTANASSELVRILRRQGTGGFKSSTPFSSAPPLGDEPE